MLTPEVRANVERWVAALRSGEYKQGKHRLRTKNNRFCCHGVACDLHDHSQWRPTSFGWEFRDRDNSMPQDVMRSLGVNNPMSEQLVGMNDGGKSFTEIADHIEVTLLKEPTC